MYLNESQTPIAIVANSWSQVEDNVTEGAALIKTNESKISKIFAKAITFIRKIF